MHLDDEGAAQKAEKWRQTAIEAIKQCGTPWLPRIEEPLSLAAFMARKETFELALVGSLQSGARHPRQCFEEFRARHQRSPTTLAWWIGPEGDFTLEELALIRSTGAQPVSFGSNVLRCETAATYALSIVNYELGDPGSALEEKN